MAVGGFNGTDPSPTLQEFQRLVAEKKIHYYVRGRVTLGRWRGGSSRSGEAEDIAQWVETHFAPMTMDRSVIYDLTQPPKNT